MPNNNTSTFSCLNCNNLLRYPIEKHIRFKCPNCNTPYEVDPAKEGKPVVVSIDTSEKHIKEETKEASKESETKKTKSEEEDSLWDTLLNLVGILFTVPLFLILIRIIPDFNWVFNLDRILLFILTLGIIISLLDYIRVTTSILVVVCIGYLTYGSIAGYPHYGWRRAVLDYKTIIYSCTNDAQPIDVIINTLTINERQKIYVAANYRDSLVRNFALKCTREYTEFNELINQYPEYRTEIQSFAICKYIHQHWNYVSDPDEEEYFAKASESVQHLSGDCEDHAILMTSCIKAIGGTPRIVLAAGHAYPEMKVNKDDFIQIQYLIKEELFADEIKDSDQLYYHTENGDIWLNLDYTNDFPGGEFMNSDKIISVVSIQ